MPSILAGILGIIVGAAIVTLFYRRRREPVPLPITAAVPDQTTRLAEAGRRLAEVAHELNNPLAAILAFAQDLLRADPSPDQRDALQVIQQQARRSRNLVRGLLEEVRAAPRPAARVDPPAVVARVLPVFEREAERHGLRFTTTSDPDLPPVEGDASAIEQVLTNLLQNAFHATPRGGAVTLSTRVRGRLLEFVVQDSGPGIPEEHLARIFEPFFTTKGAGEGTGLGLSVSQTIIRRHRGTLVAENIPDWEGSGARFVVALPFMDRRRNDRDPPEDDSVAGPAGPPGGRALLIEDDEAVRHSVRRYLERYGWAVEEAADGALGVTRALESSWDVIICDLRMPGLSGIEIHGRVAESVPTTARRFILMSGDATADEVRAFQERTGQPVLEKPFELAALGAAIQRAMGAGGAA